MYINSCFIQNQKSHLNKLIHFLKIYLFQYQYLCLIYVTNIPMFWLQNIKNWNLYCFENVGSSSLKPMNWIKGENNFYRKILKCSIQVCFNSLFWIHLRLSHHNSILLCIPYRVLLRLQQWKMITHMFSSTVIPAWWGRMCTNIIWQLHL